MFRRILLPAVVGAAALAVPGVASAAATVDFNNTTIASDTEALGTYHLDGQDILGVSKWNVDVDSKAMWTADLQTHIGWDTANVRQGASLNVTRMMPLMNGTMKVSWRISGSVHVGQLGGGFSTKNLSVEATCLPATLGSSADCTANSPAIYLLRTPGLPNSPYVKLFLKTKFSITPEGIITNRTFTTSDGSELREPPAHAGHQLRDAEGAVRAGRLLRELPPGQPALHAEGLGDPVARHQRRPDGPGARRRRDARALRGRVRPVDQVQPGVRPHRLRASTPTSATSSRTTSSRRSR